MSRRYIGSLIDAFNAFKVANAPTIGTPTGAVNAKACVVFCAPSCVGGGAITSYTAVSCPCFKVGTGSSSPVQVTCLTNGTAYTFRVSANNAYGPSAFSAASGSVTPVAGGTVGIFALGCNSCNVATTTRNKYTFSGCVNAAATASSAVSWQGSAAGTAFVGIFALGNNTAVRNKYTYASCTNAVTTSASNSSRGSSAAGNCAIGIFALGRVCNATSTTRNKFTYSSCTNGAATSA